MAINNWVNYAAIAPQSSGLGELFENVLKGYKMEREPTKIRQEELAREFDNQLKQQQAKYYGPNIESEIGLRGAQGRLMGEQAKYYGPNIQSEMGLREAQKGLYGAQGQQALANALKIQRMLEDLGGGGQGSPSPFMNTMTQGGGSDNTQPSMGYQQPQTQAQPQQSPTLPVGNGQGALVSQSAANAGGQGVPVSSVQSPLDQIKQLQGSNANAPYGIPTPILTPDDKRNKIFYGVDSYGPRYQAALKEQEDQKNKYTEKALNTGKELDSVRMQDEWLKKFKSLMDKSYLSGPVGSKLKIPTELSQEIDSVSAQLHRFGIEQLRNSMGSARFSNLDIGVAGDLKPNRTWGAKAIKDYTDMFGSIKNRMEEKEKFYRIASNPRSGIPSQLADAGWSAYQQSHPIVSDSKTGAPFKYKDGNWKEYLSPQAMKSLAETGDYKPKDSGLKEIKLPARLKSMAESMKPDEVARLIAEKRKGKK